MCSHSHLKNYPKHKSFVPPFGLPPCGNEDRELFYRLMNLDDNLSTTKYIEAAHAYVAKLQSWAGEYLNKPDIPELEKRFEYSDDAFANRLNAVYEQVAREAQAKTDGLKDPKNVPSLEQFLDDIIQNTPFNFTDGAWVRGIYMRTAYVTEDIMRIFRVLQDELGDGNFGWNHSNLWRTLCHSAGYYPKDPKDHDFAFGSEFKSFAFVCPNYQLCISQFSKMYYPEILGFTLSLEWSQVSLMYKANLMPLINVDPVYFTMHQTVDNSSTGHGRLGYEAVQLYMNSLPESIKASHWERIWRSYIIFQKTNDLSSIISTDPIKPGKIVHPSDPVTPSGTLRQQMIDMINEKAPYAQYNHQDKTLIDANTGHPKKLNDFFHDASSVTPGGTGAENLLDSLAKTPTLINPDDPLNSGIYNLMAFDSEMYGVFSEEEQMLWYRWISSLKTPPVPPITDLAKQMEAAIQTIRGLALNCTTHKRIVIPSGSKTSVNDLLNSEHPAEVFMKALSSDGPIQQVFLKNVNGSANMGKAWGTRIPGTERTGKDIANEWVQKGCPLPSGKEEVGEDEEEERKMKEGEEGKMEEGEEKRKTRRVVAPKKVFKKAIKSFATINDAPVFTDAECKLFYKMMNIEENLQTVEWLNKAQDYVFSWTDWADKFAPNSKDPLDHPFDYTEKALDERMNAIYKVLVSGAQAQIKTVENGTCPNVAQTVYSLKQHTPFGLLEGCWLRGTPLAIGPVHRDQTNLFHILQDELGAGNIAHNHSLLWRTTVQEAGYIPSDPYHEDFTKQYLPQALSLPLYELCCSQFSTKYYPEILGMTLWLEWSTVTFMYQVALMKYHQIDPTYFSMHQTIDNAATGHGRMGLDAVKHYLRRIQVDKGDKVMQETWHRIWNSTLCFKYQSSILEDAISAELQKEAKTTLAERMVTMIQRKAPYARFNHQQAKLPNQEKTLNEMFAASIGNVEAAQELLDAIAKSSFVNPASPLDSPIFTKMKFNDKMYGVFEQDEQLLWLQWITSLAGVSSGPTPLPSKTARQSISRAQTAGDDANMKKAIDYLRQNVNCPAHAYIPAGSGTVESTLAQGSDAMMAALRSSSELRNDFLSAVHGGGPMSSVWAQVIPGIGMKGSVIADAWCQNVREWVKDNITEKHEE